MSKKEEEALETPVLTDMQFAELRKLFQTYLRITAIGAIREITDSEMAKNTWLLNEAGYKQPEIARILGSSQPTISRILAGEPTKRKGKQEEAE